MDDYGCETPEHFLFGTVRVRVLSAESRGPIEGVLVRVADEHEAALGKR